MQLGVFRLQGVIAQQLSHPMAKGCNFHFINKPHTRLDYVPGHYKLHISPIPAFVKKGQRSKTGQDAPIHADT